MPSEKERIDKINRDIKKKHDKYLDEYNELITQYSNRKDEYNGSINQINSEKVSMRDELKRLYDFLTFVGGTLDKKISIFDFVKESLALNISKKEVPAVEDGYDSDLLLFKHFINKKRANEKEKELYFKGMEYTKSIKDLKQKIARMNDNCAIAEEYFRVLVIVRDSIKDRIIPEIQYIRAFLIADSIHEKYISGNDFEVVTPTSIVELKDTKYNSLYQFVRNAFDFYDLCEAFFKKPVLTELLSLKEITEEDREEFNRSIYAVQDKLAILEEEMEDV